MAEVTMGNVTKSYGEDVIAVDKMNLDIPDGEFVVFVGPSGSGKSTALRMIAGLEDISASKVFIGDQVVKDLPPRERDIAMVFQNYAPTPAPTGEDRSTRATATVTSLPVPSTALSSTCAPGKCCGGPAREPQQRFETRGREGKIEVRKEGSIW
jgi:ABC-type polar amino acid transport system ATPase subunit